MLIKLILGIISGVATKIRDDNNRKKALKELNKKSNELNTNYFKESNNDYLDTGEGKNSVTVLRNMKREQDSALSNNVARAGTTPEADVVKAAAINKSYADAVGRLATVGLRNKETLKRRYENKIETINDKKFALNNSRKNILSYIF